LSRPIWESKEPITFVYDRMPPGQGAAQHLELNDEPLSFNPQARRYAGRTAYIRRVELPEDLFVGVGRTYVEALLSQYPEGMS
jgi:hypothetical protein